MTHPRTVEQLITELQKLDPNTEIGVAHPTHSILGSWTYEPIAIQSVIVRKTMRCGWWLVQCGENLDVDDETKKVLVIT